MRRASPFVAMALLALQGCTVNEVITAEETELVVADDQVDEALLLDIGIVEFDDGVPEDNDPTDTRIYEEIRGAEARYLPYHLKTTLQGTGHWGAVRVIPSRQAFTDIIISGRIDKSDGEYVKLEVWVDDDIIARQLREAALAEEDPELRERLWEEYRKYNGI